MMTKEIFIDFNVICDNCGMMKNIGVLRDGARQFLETLDCEEYKIILCSNHRISSMWDWLRHYEINHLIYNIKPELSCVRINDRYIQYDGDYELILEALDRYQYPVTMEYDNNDMDNNDTDNNELLFKRITENLKLKSDRLPEHTISNIDRYISVLKVIKHKIINQAYEEGKLIFITHEDNTKQEE